MDTIPNIPPHRDLSTARIYLTTLLQVIDLKSQLASLQDFIDGLPHVPAVESPSDEIDRCCVICRQSLWPSEDSESSEEPVRLHCCGKIIGGKCLNTWLSPQDDGGGNAHSCPFCRKKLIVPWPKEDEPDDEPNDVPDDPEEEEDNDDDDDDDANGDDDDDEDDDGDDDDDDDHPEEESAALDPVVRWVHKWVQILGWEPADDDYRFVDIIYQDLGDIKHPRELTPGHAIQGPGSNVIREQGLLLDLGTWEETTET